ncbi:hypothetical protein M426DRAFT_193297 [Hypoxylon sp. CI-4A]|nr:hypothetical protein M426DRAFT_193297 [Hypoxylon sp. CI-4A]
MRRSSMRTQYPWLIRSVIYRSVIVILLLATFPFTACVNRKESPRQTPFDNGHGDSGWRQLPHAECSRPYGRVTRCTETDTGTGT